MTKKHSHKSIIDGSLVKIIVGLGNPGPHYYFQKHSIGFRVLDALCNAYGSQWHKKQQSEEAEISINNRSFLLIKPLTFMNSSGVVLQKFKKVGLQPSELLVIHDELEKPFGNLSFKLGGSHKGHNGLKSIIEQCGLDFVRFRFGIGRPERKGDVPTYVLQPFKAPPAEIDKLIAQSVSMIHEFIIT